MEMEILTRLKKILSHYNLTSSTFADTIDVQRSSISHLLSGRNKPSLDFIMKTVNKFPEVDLYWFLYGEGIFPKKEEVIPKEKEIIEPKINIEEKVIEKKDKIASPTLLPENKISINNLGQEIKTTQNSKKLVKIVLLYNDGSFNEFNQ